MPNYRCQIAHRKTGGLPIDDVVNTIFLRDSGPTTDPLNLATSLTAIFANVPSRPSSQAQVECRIYDLADAEPRQAKATHIRNQIGASSVAGPREVALCLSFYSQRNLPRSRGRIYVGPISNTFMLERPSVTLRDALKTLANGIAGVGGIDVDWCVFSPTTAANAGNAAAMQAVSNSWVDDEWDTMRSRGLESTTRTTATHDEDPA